MKNMRLFDKLKLVVSFLALLYASLIITSIIFVYGAKSYYQMEFYKAQAKEIQECMINRDNNTTK